MSKLVFEHMSESRVMKIFLDKNPKNEMEGSPQKKLIQNIQQSFNVLYLGRIFFEKLSILEFWLTKSKSAYQVRILFKLTLYFGV